MRAMPMSQRVHNFRMRVNGVPGVFRIFTKHDAAIAFDWCCDCEANIHVTSWLHSHKEISHELYCLYLTPLLKPRECACTRWMKIEKVFLEAMR